MKTVQIKCGVYYSLCVYQTGSRSEAVSGTDEGVGEAAES